MNVTSNTNKLRYKIKVSGLPRFYSLMDPLLQEFLKMINDELFLNCIHARYSKKGNAWLYLTFSTEIEQVAALKFLKKYNWKGRSLISTLVTADRPKMNGNLKIEEENCSSKKLKLEISLTEQVLMSIIPYHSIDYEEQLRKKSEEARILFRRLETIIERKQPHLAEWCTARKRLLNSDLAFEISPIIPSNKIDHYRNKCKWNVVAVGPRVKGLMDGIHYVGPPDCLRNLPIPMITLAKKFEEFLRINGEDWKIWRNMMIRMNEHGEVMLSIILNQHNFSDLKLMKIKSSILKWFTEAITENVVSLYFQIYSDKFSAACVDKPFEGELLWGQKFLIEKLLDLSLEISPATYFRLSSLGAEELCKVVADLANVDEYTTVLDLFCGSGCLALTLAKKCKKLVGIELIKANIDDAKRNAARNGIHNCEFIAGRIEDILDSVLEKLKGCKVTVIMDPPLSGINTGLVRTIRKFKEATNLIYVCSNHKLPLKNLLDLSFVVQYCQKSIDSDPFLPLRVVPIDMCPHSLRSELVLHFKRFSAQEILLISNHCGKKLTRTYGYHKRYKTSFCHKNQLTSPLTQNTPSSSGNHGLLNYIKKIEERAYQEGLVEGLERKAFQMGYARGIQTALVNDNNKNDECGYSSF
ncbi:tRNA (uracil-5-)-methyltransferase homolog B-like isoform X2 [Daktulosphaira vitifoliae]|uniref:tRNA (uracil-5-)-methyltransferase homolog B-like isoform X2 n=1 Tax=Daktulosphaira vitifoliae TaxID=58002 RepID=UPI0021AAA141|nr:tRNA (uracil-5-)-methyltransferase homolog B-like isoform X2 [Daktulosphaira vitifoliae]